MISTPLRAHAPAEWCRSCSITVVGSPTLCGNGWRASPGAAPSECGSRYLVERDKGYDTLQLPAILYPATDDRYVVGDEPAKQAG